MTSPQEQTDFMTRVLAGDVDDLRAEVDAIWLHWLATPGQNIDALEATQLREALGMTQEELGRWLDDPGALIEIVRARRKALQARIVEMNERIAQLREQIRQAKLARARSERVFQIWVGASFSLAWLVVAISGWIEGRHSSHAAWFCLCIGLLYLVLGIWPRPKEAP